MKKPRAAELGTQLSCPVQLHRWSSTAIPFFSARRGYTRRCHRKSHSLTQHNADCYLMTSLLAAARSPEDVSDVRASTFVDPVNIKGTRFTTTRLTHHSRHTECVLMIRHIKGDVEKKTTPNTLKSCSTHNKSYSTYNKSFSPYNKSYSTYKK